MITSDYLLIKGFKCTAKDVYTKEDTTIILSIDTNTIRVCCPQASGRLHVNSILAKLFIG